MLIESIVFLYCQRLSGILPQFSQHNLKPAIFHFPNFLSTVKGISTNTLIQSLPSHVQRHVYVTYSYHNTDNIKSPGIQMEIVLKFLVPFNRHFSSEKEHWSQVCCQRLITSATLLRRLRRQQHLDFNSCLGYRVSSKHPGQLRQILSQKTQFEKESQGITQWQRDCLVQQGSRFNAHYWENKCSLDSSHKVQTETQYSKCDKLGEWGCPKHLVCEALHG